MSSSPEPRTIAPELLALSDGALSVWADPAARAAVVDRILNTWQSGDPTLPAAVERLDSAVREGLELLGLPRGPVAGVRVESVGRGWLGRKLWDCSIVFDALVMRALSDRSRPDTVFKTWVHESIHARQRPGPGAAIERAGLRGYEEGVAEGLARALTREKAAMQPLETAYTFYVEAYRALAEVLQTDAEALWRALWRYSPGQVRTALPGVVSNLHGGRGARALSVEQTRALLAVADRLFATARLRDMPDAESMNRLWTAVFR